MTSDDKPIIFVDTTCFARGFKWDDEDWQILLNASKQGDLRIVVSEIVYLERQSQWRDELVASAYRVKEAIDKLTSVWNRNHVTRNSSSPYLLAKIEIENFQKDVIAKVKGYAENLTSEHIIEIRHVQEHHTEEVLRKYFLWHGQFDSPHRDRDDKEVRNKRKTHLLDAWIMEEALDLKVRGGTLYVLCHDKKLSETLKNNDIRVFRTPKDILSELRRNQEEDISVEPDRRSPVLEPEFAVTENLDNLFNTDLITKVLGYIYWLSGGEAVAKETLIEKLNQRYGYTPEQIRITADYLTHISKVLEDTGNYYIAIDSKVLKSSADMVLPDILLLLDDE